MEGVLPESVCVGLSLLPARSLPLSQILTKTCLDHKGEMKSRPESTDDLASPASSGNIFFLPLTRIETKRVRFFVIPLINFPVRVGGPTLCVVVSGLTLWLGPLSPPL